MAGAEQKTIEVEPLTFDDVEQTIVALATLFDRAGCCPAITVSSHHEAGVGFSVYFDAERARKLIASLQPKEGEE